MTEAQLGAGTCFSLSIHVPVLHFGVASMFSLGDLRRRILHVQAQVVAGTILQVGSDFSLHEMGWEVHFVNGKGSGEGGSHPLSRDLVLDLRTDLHQ